MDAENAQNLLVPSLKSSNEDVEKCEAILIHNKGSLSHLRDLADMFEVEGHEKVSLSVTQTSNLIALLLQYSEVSFWSTEEHLDLSKNLIGYVCRANEIPSLQSLLSLVQDDATVLSKVTINSFKFFLDKVQKDCFDSNPAACCACYNIIVNTNGRKVASCLPFFLPFTLNHIDHYLPTNKIRGMKLLTHILNNVTSSELLWSGLGDLFYETLQKLFYSNENEILEIFYPCFLLLLSKSTRNPTFVETFCEWTKYDEAITLTLQHMRFESSVKNQQVYLKALSDLMRTMDQAVNKHALMIIKVLTEYCDGSFVFCSDSIVQAIECFDIFFTILDFEIEHYLSEFLKVLLKLLNDHRNNSKIVDLCKRLLSSVYFHNDLCKQTLNEMKTKINLFQSSSIIVDVLNEIVE